MISGEHESSLLKIGPTLNSRPGFLGLYLFESENLRGWRIQSLGNFLEMAHLMSLNAVLRSLYCAVYSLYF